MYPATPDELLDELELDELLEFEELLELEELLEVDELELLLEEALELLLDDELDEGLPLLDELELLAPSPLHALRMASRPRLSNDLCHLDGNREVIKVALVTRVDWVLVSRNDT